MARIGQVSRKPVVAAALAAAALVAGCGSDGAGAGPGFTQVAPVDPGTVAPPVAATVAVSQAVPSNGNGVVTVGAGTSTLVQDNLRRVRFEGVADTGLRHRFTLDYDVATGAAVSLAHEWDDGTGAVDAFVQCARTVLPGVLQICQGVAVDLASNRVSFAGTRLRGQAVSLPALGTTSVVSAAGLPFTLAP